MTSWSVALPMFLGRAYTSSLCTDQYQICNENNGRCTGFSGLSALNEYTTQTTKLELSDRQGATYVRLNTLASMYSAVYGVPDSVLANGDLISTSTSKQLPNNQWAREVESWFQAVLSRFQLVQSVFPDIPNTVLEQNNVAYLSASGAASLFPGSVGDELVKQCHQQRVRAPQEYQSYNLFALIIILIFGLLVPGAAIVMKKLHQRLPGVDPRGVKYISYHGESLLQLHRQTLESSGYRGWAGGVSDEPRTTTAEKRLPLIVLGRGSIDGKPITRYPRAGDNVDSDDTGRKTKEDYEAVARVDSDMTS
ncbi:hypothetical protein LTR09_009399 [Extremus antarcticus]|uniref:Uncharacterized protein n=1 Tax=Extremus antarcticus TaxID=702011 RepID=A0AAJ0G9F8_9PEZI|nr:hypothetical protein LTR09_009399 [Extremus antarcticus]